jgi:hypothetical protein
MAKAFNEMKILIERLSIPLRRVIDENPAAHTATTGLFLELRIGAIRSVLEVEEGV